MGPVSSSNSRSDESMSDPVHSSNSRSAIPRLGTVQGRTTSLPNPCTTSNKKILKSTIHWQKSKILSLPEKKELWIFSNKHYHNKNERPRSVLKASKFKILSRVKIGKKNSSWSEWIIFFFTAFTLDIFSILFLLWSTLLSLGTPLH